MIIIATHKNTKFPTSTLYQPLHVGSINAKEDFEICRDDTGDNISNKNGSFCELTGLYWLWKNNSNELVGLVHYRRYFKANGLGILFNDFNIFGDDDVKYIGQHDVILPKKIRFFKKKIFKMSVQEQYANAHEFSDWVNLKELIKREYFDYYPYFEIVERSNEIYAYNMFVSHRGFLDEYCSWLFDVLFNFEEKYGRKYLDSYQSRIYGFLAERLFNVFIEKNKNKYTFIENEIVFME